METRSPPPPSGIPQSLGKTSATDVEVLLEFLFHDGKLVREPYLLLVHIRYDRAEVVGTCLGKLFGDCAEFCPVWKFKP